MRSWRTVAQRCRNKGRKSTPRRSGTVASARTENWCRAVSAGNANTEVRYGNAAGSEMKDARFENRRQRASSSAAMRLTPKCAASGSAA